jgi:hypothetical protein
VLPPEGRAAAWDARAELQPVAGSAEAVLPPAELVAGSGAAGPLPEEEVARDVAAAVPRRAAAQAEAAAVRPPGAAVPVSGVPRRGAPDVPAVLPSAAAWAVLPCLRAVLPAPSTWVRSAHARKDLRIAQP